MEQLDQVSAQLDFDNDELFTLETVLFITLLCHVSTSRISNRGVIRIPAKLANEANS